MHSIEPALNSSTIEERFIELAGSRMRYLHAGSGPPVLLVHGLMGYSFSWRNTIPALAERLEVFAIDALGTGYSDRPPALDCRLKACAQRLLRFMDAVSSGPFHMLGTSHVGAIAMMAAALLPGRVRRLTLVAPVNPWAPRGRKLAPFLSHPLVAPLFAQLATHSRSLRRHYFHRLWGDPRRIPPGTFEGYMKPLEMAGIGAWDYGLSVLRNWNGDLRELELALPRIANIPTLLIWGMQDKAVAPESAGRLKQNFRQCQLVVMDGIGHLPYEEAPDEFDRAVREFLFSASDSA
jgi:pimeloyl-ACP methyl ester carboxylesterase